MRLSLILVLLFALLPVKSWGCACGCGLFEVQTSGLMPTQPGGNAFLEFDTMDQNDDRVGRQSTSADNNTDKRIQTRFYTAGAQYLFNRRWGVMSEVPLWDRTFVTTDDSGNLANFRHTAAGDLRLQGLYTGLSPDLSTGLSLGLKLPTGDYKNRNFDRDTEIGTGSTDLLLGAYHMDRFAIASSWAWFMNAQGGLPFLFSGGYRPGADFNASLGAYFDGWRPGGVLVAPLAQVIASKRWQDRGPKGHPDASGYRRAVLSPGLEVAAAGWRLNGSVGFPVYQYVTGYQLTAREFYRASVSRSF